MKEFEGLIQDQKLVDEVQRLLPFPVFSAAPSDIKDTGKGKIMLGHKLIEKAYGSFYIRHQKGPSCVSMGEATSCDLTYAYDIVVNKAPYTFVAPTATEDIYSGSRMIIGGGKLGRGGGSLGIWGARYTSEYGTLFRQQYDGYDLTNYRYDLEKKWANQRIPESLLKEAAKNKIQTITQIENYEDCRDCLYNGYGVTIASNVGFGSSKGSHHTVRDKDGFARQSGSWLHQMCAVPGTIIQSTTPKFIEDIVVGDNVFGHDGNLHKVTEVFERKINEEIVNIKVYGACGTPLQLTKNHPVYVLRESKGSTEEDFKVSKSQNGVLVSTRKKTKQWVNAGDIKVGDYVVCPSVSFENEGYIPEWIGYDSKRCKRKPSLLEYDDDVAWLFGLYAADGNAHKGHKIVITFHINDENNVKRCAKAIQKLGLNPSILYYERFIRVVAYSSIVANSFAEWFGKQENKQLPEWIWSWNMKEVLSGIFAGDGCQINDKRKRITNTSLKLINQIHSILLNLGEIPSITKKTYAKEGQENWKDRYDIEWSNSSKKHFNYWDKNDLFMKVKEISRENYNGFVYNFEVEDVHSYIANHSVVHNCVIAVDDANARPGVLVMNSWGAGASSGPKKFEQPDGSFWIDAETFNKIARQGDTWARSTKVGYPKATKNTGDSLYV